MKAQTLRCTTITESRKQTFAVALLRESGRSVVAGRFTVKRAPGTDGRPRFSTRLEFLPECTDCEARDAAIAALGSRLQGKVTVVT